jgi:hypothetical protein
MFNRIVNDFNSPRFNLLVTSPEKGEGFVVSCVFFNQELFLFQLFSGAYSFSIGTSKFDIGYCLKFGQSVHENKH